MDEFKSGDIVIVRPECVAELIEQIVEQLDSTTTSFLEHLMTGKEFVVLQTLPPYYMIQDVLIGKQMYVSKHFLMLKNSDQDTTEFLNLL